MRICKAGTLVLAILLSTSAGFANATAFDCNDTVPHSDAYDNGNFDAAFKELEPTATARCAEAEHLLGVMYAEGHGVKKDFAHAYALLLLAYSDGMSPVGKRAAVPVVGDDESELEIVQFGAQLTNDQLVLAEKLATKLAAKRGKYATTETAGPSEVANSAKELRPQIAGYRLNGQFASIELPEVATPLSLGMSAAAPGHVLAQVVTDANSKIIPYQLAAVEMRLLAVGRGVPRSDYELKRVIELAESQGERFEWLKSGARVRVVKFSVNAGFAAQVQLLDQRVPAAAERRYWVNHCFLVMEDPQYQARCGGL
jgi:TPR repeat protein